MKTLKEWREARGLRQLDLAYRVGVTPATIANWESARREPSASYLHMLAKALDVSMDEIDVSEWQAKPVAA